MAHRRWLIVGKTRSEGTPETVRRGLESFIARTAPDELIVGSQILDHDARPRSYELTAKVRDELAVAPVA